MKINFEGREWEFDEDEVDVRQATVLYLAYKMTLRDWIAGIVQVDQRSLHFTYWLMLQQNGVVKPIADCNPKIIGFAAAYSDAREAASAAAEAAAEPEVPVPAVPTIPSTAGAASPGPATPTATTPPMPPAQVPLTTAY